MAAKAIVFFTSALFIQSIYCQCIGSLNNINAAEGLALSNALAYNMAAGPNLAYGGLAPNLAFNPSSGGSFAVTSSSPIAPTGIQVFSENAIEGTLAMNGELPFLGAVVIEGALPTAGAGGINYGCGAGAIGIVSEGIAPAGAAPARGYAGLAGPGLAGPGLGGPVAYNSLAAGRPCGPMY